ncbi:MAG: class I SAM-dependent methyltransferase, partial [Magnetococcales bacterium]|nr:class I SAM-dependent methyltransferase [Magnetococcales bacterium]
IACLGLGSDRTSQIVRDQYEANPYPRWVKTAVSSQAHTVTRILQGMRIVPKPDDKQLSSLTKILVAGCGTGEQAVVSASRFLNCTVLGVDLSLSSLSYGIRKTRELGISNIEYIQGDILELDKLGRQFDIVECSGVLHHMEHPLAGWRVLVDTLRPNGLMRVALYSEIARESIIKAREFIREQGFSSSQEDIRLCRKKISSFAGDSALGFAKILQVSDFYSLSECRDLLFHVQEHRFTLPQIAEALQNLGLEFLGFELQDSQVMKKFVKLYPEKDAHLSLDNWHRFEILNPDVFIGMYQFWVQKITGLD